MAARDAVRRQPNQAGEQPAKKQHPTVAMLSNPKTIAELAKAMPPGLSVERFLRVARTAVQMNPKLLACTPESMIAAIHKAAALGLDVGPVGHAYLVPFGGKVQLIIGYRGMLSLARRSGQLADVQAHAVHEGDEFEYRYGLDPVLRHVPKLCDPGEKGPIVCFYGVARFTNGGTYFVVVDLDTINEHRKVSKTGFADDSPWNTDFASMGRKTVVRIMEPYLPLTAETAEVMQDEEVKLDRPTEFIEANLVPSHEPEPDVPDPGEKVAEPIEATAT